MPISKIKTSSITADAASINLNIDANTLFLDVANNRVGVGTTSPYRQLQIGDYSTNAVMALGSSAAGTGTFCFASSDSAPGRYVGTIGYNHQTNAMIFGVNAVEAARFDSSGNLGIGTTNPSSYSSKLALVGNSGSGATQLFISGGGNAGDYGIVTVGISSTAHGRLVADANSGNFRIDTAGRNSAILFMTGSSYAERMRIDSNGDTVFSSVGFVQVSSGTTAERPATTAGRLRWNTTLSQLEVADGTSFEKVLLDTLVTSATGGTITTDGQYRIHTFTSSGTFTVTTVSGGGSADFQVLVVGGGGAGGMYLGGGGGGGAMLEQVVNLPAGTYTVTVGAGGNPTTNGLGYSGNGANSSITGGIIGDTSLMARGGGAGGNGAIGDVWGANGSANTNIGSGGGGGSPYGFTLNSGTVHASFGGPGGPLGSGGGFGTLYSSITFNGGGGGGGALGPGVAPNIGNGPVGAGGYGGSAKTSTISGSSVSYGGGGGGGYGTYLANLSIGGGANAGVGVGTASTGAQLQATSGVANRGGGGGGGQAQSPYQIGGSGGSGIVIIRYKYV